MEINVRNLQEVIKKATLNYTIPTVQVTVEGTKVTSKMRSPTNNVVVILNTENNVISGLPDSLELNFDEPSTKVRPYLNLIDTDTANLIVSDGKITLKAGRQKTNLHLHMPSFITTFGGNEPNTTPFYTLDLDDTVKEYFNKIKKVAGKFERVYFQVKDNKFIVETTNKMNRLENGIDFELGDVKYKNLCMLFGFKNFNALLSTIDTNFNDFKAKFAWMEQQEAGFVVFEKNDGSEKYYLLSQIDQ